MNSRFNKIKEISSLLKLGEDNIDIQDEEFLKAFWEQRDTLTEYQFMAILQRVIDRTFSYGMHLSDSLNDFVDSSRETISSIHLT